MSAQEGAQVISLAERLKQRREELGLSQAQVARELDVARTAYRLWEMEAAKPQPDRWTLIASWLGVSVGTMMLINEPLEKTTGPALHQGAGTGGETTISDGQAFFTTLRAFVHEGTEKGFTSVEDAEQLLRVVAHIEKKHRGMDTEAWEPVKLHKQLGITTRAARSARQVIDFVAVGLPTETLDVARLLTSELVTNSVKYGETTSVSIDLDVEVGRDRIRVEVRDGALGKPTLTEPTDESGLGLTFVDRLANRWGTQREFAGNLTWFEIDLPAPGRSSPGTLESP